MATAKQIAARKKFSQMAKSGKLAQLRKKAARKNPAATISKGKLKKNPTPGQRTRSRTKLIQNGNGKRKNNPMQTYAIKCSRSGRTLGYADSLPMAKSMATAIANERMIPVQIVKA